MSIDINTLDFDKVQGLIPAIVQDATTKTVLMLGYMNEEALQKTREVGKVTFYSRNKNRLWTKGETSGNFLEVIDILADCDSDTLLILANPTGVVCHTGAETCFNQSNANSSFLFELEKIIANRFEHPTESSYTASLFAKGINKIAQKVGEEAVEVVIESKDENETLFKNEVADLLFHLLVLLKAKNTTLAEIESVLKARHV